jgi:hypothetical protein
MICKTCKQDLPESNFYRWKRSPYRWIYYCKTCDYVRQRVRAKPSDITPEMREALLARCRKVQQRRAQATCAVPECEATPAEVV